MKILIATGIFPPEIGGPATYAAFLANELTRRGDKVKVLPFREVRGYPRFIRHLAYFYKVFAESRKADVIFTQDPVSTGIPVVAAAYLNKKKVVMRVAGDYAWEQSVQRYGVTDTIDEFQNKTYGGMIYIMKRLQALAVKRADVVITPSHYFTKLVSSWVPTKDVRTIYNGIDLNAEYEKEPKFSDKTIISAGRLVPWKGFDTLIKILKEMPGWILFIAGDGPDKERLVKLAQSEGVSGRIQFLGQMARTELFSYIHRAHAFALLTTFESFSFQIVEAMHVGTPVIASNIGNLAEIIENGKSGILIDPVDTQKFISEAEKLVEDPGYAEALIREARERAKDFSIDKTMDEVYTVLNEVRIK
jgi:glycosyltransferase involved in cell wall biosynthesis